MEFVPHLALGHPRINDELTLEYLEEADYTLRSVDMEKIGNSRGSHMLFPGPA